MKERRETADILRAEFGSEGLPKDVSYEDKLEVGYPAAKPRVSKQDACEKVDTSYYYHLSPLIRQSVNQL